MNMKKRIHEIKIRFSPDELATLSEQVKRAGISREQFCRNAIQGVAIRENPPADLHKLIWEIRHPGKQLMSMQLTSGSGERTFQEATFRLNQERENLTLLSYSYCITGISKPADT
jgi:hypothetical protein